jgi:hypothetical protein
MVTMKMIIHEGRQIKLAVSYDSFAAILQDTLRTHIREPVSLTVLSYTQSRSHKAHC